MELMISKYIQVIQVKFKELLSRRISFPSSRTGCHYNNSYKADNLSLESNFPSSVPTLSPNKRLHPHYFLTLRAIPFSKYEDRKTTPHHLCSRSQLLHQSGCTILIYLGRGWWGGGVGDISVPMWRHNMWNWYGRALMLLWKGQIMDKIVLVMMERKSFFHLPRRLWWLRRETKQSKM